MGPEVLVWIGERGALRVLDASNGALASFAMVMLPVDATKLSAPACKHVPGLSGAADWRKELQQ